MRFSRLQRKTAGGCKFTPRSCASLALRLGAAPVCKVGAGNSVARAATGRSSRTPRQRAAALPVLKRGRGPQATPTKVLTSIRLDADIVNFFRAQGSGYQSRINDALRKEVNRNLTRRPGTTTRKRVAA